MDSSESIGGSEWFAMLEYVKTLVKSFNLVSNQTRVAVVTFAEQVVVRNHFNEYQTAQELVNSLSYPFAEGSTDTAQMLR